MKALRLFSYFLTGASSTTLAGWALAFTPFAIRLGVYVLLFLIMTIVFSLIFDDPISEFLGIDLSAYYLFVFGTALTIVAGLSVLGGLLWR
jgi:hypothetical protein